MLAPLRFLMGRIECKKWKFHSHKDENPLKLFFSHDPLLNLDKEGPEAMHKILIVMWYICYCYNISGHSLGALMYLESVVLFSCFKKYKCLGDVLDSVSLLQFAALKLQLLGVFMTQLIFWSRTSFFLLSENCGVWSNNYFSMLRKKCRYNSIGHLFPTMIASFLTKKTPNKKQRKI